MAVYRTQETINQIKYTGFSTSFSIPKEELQKLWWKYSKGIGIVENMKSHYLIKIPSQEKGLSTVSLLETTSGDEKSANIFLAVLDQTNNAFKEQVKDVLIEFKVQYYVKQVEKKIALKEKELQDAGEQYSILLNEEIGVGKKKNILESITKLSYELDKLKQSLSLIKV